MRRTEVRCDRFDQQLVTGVTELLKETFGVENRGAAPRRGRERVHRVVAPGLDSPGPAALWPTGSLIPALAASASGAR